MSFGDFRDVTAVERDAVYRAGHRDCEICGEKCCLDPECLDCHPAERGVVAPEAKAYASKAYVHAGRCEAIFAAGGELAVECSAGVA